MENLTEKVLMVDDDRNLLDSFRRQFRKHLNLETAASGADGIQAIRDDGPFAVVISDMQMPNMNGVEFLSRVNALSPNTVRVMLTGNANLDVAISAVNDGQIFRFLNKPVESNQLLKVITAGINQYRLVTAEKILLSKTLKGAVDLLADILSLVNPTTFSQSSRIKRHVQTMLKSLVLEDRWLYDLAAMLCQIGLVALPHELIAKAARGEALSQTESRLYASHPGIGSRLLKHIPRLETVAAMVQRQDQNVGSLELEGRLDSEQQATLGGQILKVAIAYDRLTSQGMDGAVAIATLKANPDEYDPMLVETLSLSSQDLRLEMVNLSIDELQPGLILDQAITSHAGMLLVAKGQVLSQAVILRLLAAQESGIVDGRIRAFRVLRE